MICGEIPLEGEREREREAIVVPSRSSASSKSTSYLHSFHKLVRVFKGKSENTWREWRDVPVYIRRWSHWRRQSLFLYSNVKGCPGGFDSASGTSTQEDPTCGKEVRWVREGAGSGAIWRGNISLARGMLNKFRFAGKIWDTTWAHWDRRLKRPILKLHQISVQLRALRAECLRARCPDTQSGNPISKALRIFLQWLSWFWFYNRNYHWRHSYHSRHCHLYSHDYHNEHHYHYHHYHSWLSCNIRSLFNHHSLIITQDFRYYHYYPLLSLISLISVMSV